MQPAATGKVFHFGVPFWGHQQGEGRRRGRVHQHRYAGCTLATRSKRSPEKNVVEEPINSWANAKECILAELTSGRIHENWRYRSRNSMSSLANSVHHFGCDMWFGVLNSAICWGLSPSSARWSHLSFKLPPMTVIVQSCDSHSPWSSWCLMPPFLLSTVKVYKYRCQHGTFSIKMEV